MPRLKGSWKTGILHTTGPAPARWVEILFLSYFTEYVGILLEYRVIRSASGTPTRLTCDTVSRQG